MSSILKMIEQAKQKKNKDKWFIQFPIPKSCNLRCKYCFHQQFFQREAKGITKSDEYAYYYDRGFSYEEWNRWYDTHIRPNSSETIIHLAGGDPFCHENSPVVFEFMDNTDHTVDLLTNGLGSLDTYRLFFKEFGNRIHRIGFTFHRKTLTEKQRKQYERSVILAKNLGVTVYVKEILFPEYKDKILEHRKKWNNEGIPLKIQDFENLDASPVAYTPEELALISQDYKHKGEYCSCWEGWRSIAIRGYDIANGNIVACWLDPKIIGNVRENTFNPNFKVLIDHRIGRRNVIGVPCKYSETGTYERDRMPTEYKV